MYNKMRPMAKALPGLNLEIAEKTTLYRLAKVMQQTVSSNPFAPLSANVK